MINKQDGCDSIAVAKRAKIKLIIPRLPEKGYNAV